MDRHALPVKAMVLKMRVTHGRNPPGYSRKEPKSPWRCADQGSRVKGGGAAWDRATTKSKRSAVWGRVYVKKKDSEKTLYSGRLRAYSVGAKEDFEKSWLSRWFGPLTAVSGCWVLSIRRLSSGMISKSWIRRSKMRRSDLS